MESFEIRWERATGEVKKLLKENLSILNEGLNRAKGRKTTIAFNDTTEDSDSEPGTVNLNINNITDFAPKVMDNIDINSELWHSNLVRNFGEIVREGPRNDKEAGLLFTASLTLSPEELKNCVDKNLPVNDVMTKISIARGLEAVKELAKLVEEKKEVVKEVQQQQPELKEPEKDPLQSFKEGFGIMPKVSEELNKPIIPEKPMEQEKTKPEVSPAAPDKPEIMPEKAVTPDIKEVQDILKGVDHIGEIGKKEEIKSPKGLPKMPGHDKEKVHHGK